MNQLLALDRIREKILILRGQRVMLDMHLAELYGVETKVLKRAVKRNIDRFPSDFCLTLTAKETENLRYHFGTSSGGNFEVAICDLKCTMGWVIGDRRRWFF